MKRFLLALFVTFLASSPASAITREWGYDRPGLDYSNFELSSPRVILCEWSCQKDRRCKAWTYVKPGYQGPKARCWLKWAVPRLVKNSCCDSGTP